MSHYAYAALAAAEAGDNYAYAACAHSHAIKRKSNRILVRRRVGGNNNGVELIKRSTKCAMPYMMARNNVCVCLCVRESVAFMMCGILEMR